MSQFVPEELNIITWNISRKNDIQQVVNYLKMQKFPLHVIFLQETAIGVDGETNLNDWHAFYTKYSDDTKGVAILVKKTENLQFELYNQEVDRNGSYVIVQCKLRGQEYTLVSVYNRTDDTTTLDLLTPFLRTMTVGTLVIGGDFNTTFSLNDRAYALPPSTELQRYDEPNYQHIKTLKLVKKFMEYLQLDDVFREKYPTRFDNKCFTFHTTAKGQKPVFSRLDYFFIPKKHMGLVKKCAVLTNDRRGHRPLFLQLEVKYKSETEDDYQNVSSVEIVAAVQFLHLKLDIKRIHSLKEKYNQILNNETPLPQNMCSVGKKNFFDEEYLILATILAWRLENGDKAKTTDISQIGEHQTGNYWNRKISPQIESKVKWSYLQKCISEKMKDHPCFDDFSILEQMLQNDAKTGKKQLWNVCPLTYILLKITA